MRLDYSRDKSMKRPVAISPPLRLMLCLFLFSLMEERDALTKYVVVVAGVKQTTSNKSPGPLVHVFPVSCPRMDYELRRIITPFSVLRCLPSLWPIMSDDVR